MGEMKVEITEHVEAVVNDGVGKTIKGLKDELN